jgi:hypothetical protein
MTAASHHQRPSSMLLEGGIRRLSMKEAPNRAKILRRSALCVERLKG